MGSNPTPSANQQNQLFCEFLELVTTSGNNTFKFIQTWSLQSIHVTKALPSGSSELRYEALKNAGAVVTFYTIAGAGHEDPKYNSGMMRAAVKAFIDKI